MRDNPIHSLFQVLTGQIHHQLALGLDFLFRNAARGSRVARLTALAS